MRSGKFEGTVISGTTRTVISHRDSSKAPTEPVPGSPEIFSNMATSSTVPASAT